MAEQPTTPPVTPDAPAVDPIMVQGLMQKLRSAPVTDTQVERTVQLTEADAKALADTLEALTKSHEAQAPGARAGQARAGEAKP